MTLTRRSMFKRATVGGTAVLGAVAFPATLPALAQTTSDYELICTEDNVRIRSKPRLSGRVRSTIDTGERVRVTGVSVAADGYDWIPVTVVGTNVSGWTTAQHFERPEGEIGWLPGTVVHVNTTGVNLHAGAGVNYDVVGNFNTGTEGVVNDGPATADGYNWYNITIDNVTGWMVEDYLTEGRFTGDAATTMAAASTTGSTTGDAHLVIGDGTNQTAALRAALEAARDSPSIKTVRILGEVRIDAFDQSGDNLPTILYSGCTLEGAGYSSCLAFEPSRFAAGKTYIGIRYQARTTLRNFRINGNRNGIDDATWSEYSTIALAGEQGNSDFPTFDHLWIHDLGGKQLEAFTILGADGERGATASFLWTWDNDGTGGYHPSGIPTGRRGGDAELSRIYSWNNGWQGMSMYGVDNVRISDSHAWNNGNTGFNTEWATGVDYYACVSHDNGLGGFTTHGAVDVRLHNPIIYNNDKTDSGNEITVLAARYGDVTSVARKLEIFGGMVTPPPGNAHIWYEVGSNVTEGRSVPEICIHHHEAHNWSIWSSASGAITAATFAEAPTISSVPLGYAFQWPGYGGASESWASGVGEDSSDAYTLSASASGNSRSTAYRLLPGRRYLVRMRVRSLQAGRPWVVDFCNRKGEPLSSVLTLPNHAVDVEEWYSIDTIVATGSTARNIRFTNTYNGSNSMIIDYLVAYEVGGNFYASTYSPPAITGSRGGNQALSSLLAQLDALGIVVDTTTG